MYTSKRTIYLCALLLCAAGVRPADAQMLEWQDTVFVNVSGGAQAGSQEFQQALAFGLYGEAATLRAPFEISSGGLFDIGGGVRVSRNFGAGISFSRFARSEDVAVDASLPHPIFFNLPRPASAAVGGAKHRQNSIHLQAIYMLPLSDRIDIAFSAGPSIVSVDQTVITGLTIQQPEIPPFNPNVTSVAVTDVSDTTVGFNIGADWSYLITSPQSAGAMPAVGAGLFLRYVTGSADLPEVPDVGTQSVDVGGFQIGVGARLRWR